MIKTATQFKTYNGRNIDQMPLMLAEGVVPLPVFGFMQNREGIVEQFGDIYVDTSDLVAYGGKGASDEIKMVLTVDNQGRITEDGRKALGLINPLQERDSGALVLNDKVYGGFNGAGVVLLSRNDMDKYVINKSLTETQVLNHPGWRVLLRYPDAVPDEFAYDKGLMQEIVGRTFAEMKKRHTYTEGMGFYLDEAGKTPKMRAWYVDWLGYRSGAYGRSGLDDDGGRLLGITPEAPSALGKVASVVRPYNAADLQAFDKAMKGLEGILRPEVLEPFVDLRKKL